MQCKVFQRLLVLFLIDYFVLTPYTSKQTVIVMLCAVIVIRLKPMIYGHAKYV